MGVGLEKRLQVPMLARVGARVRARARARVRVSAASDSR